MSEEKPRAADEDAGADDPVESAGETTAADAVSGPADARPVGAGTLVDVEDEPAPESAPTDSE